MTEKHRLKMIEKFQCPGCVWGHDTQCERFVMDDHGHSCTSHVNGTSIGLGPLSSIALGLPKGFCKAGYVGPEPNHPDARQNRMWIRLWAEGEQPEWDKFNVPVWAMEKDDHLFVRTYLPRINVTAVDVVEQGTLGLVPNAIDVGEFYDEID